MVNISFGSRSLETWGFAIFVLHPQIDILEEFKIMNPPCPSCEDILRQVDISFEAEMHVIQRHYSSERVQDRSMFTSTCLLWRSCRQASLRSTRRSDPSPSLDLLLQVRFYSGKLSKSTRHLVWNLSCESGVHNYGVPKSPLSSTFTRKGSDYVPS